jgi:hypothetical protein
MLVKKRCIFIFLSHVKSTKNLKSAYNNLIRGPFICNAAEFALLLHTHVQRQRVAVLRGLSIEYAIATERIIPNEIKIFIFFKPQFSTNF